MDAELDGVPLFLQIKHRDQHFHLVVYCVPISLHLPHTIVKIIHKSYMQ